MKISVQLILNSLRRTLFAVCTTVLLCALIVPCGLVTQAQKSGDDSSREPIKFNQQLAGDLSEVSEVRLPADQIIGAANRSADALAQAETSLVEENEPNNTAATAFRLSNNQAKVRGDLIPNADVDFYSFYANAGDRVFAATVTTFSGSGGDSVLDLIGTDGTTVIETDNEDGSFTANASSIAGRAVPTTGLYYLSVRNFSTAATNEIRPYDLYLRVQSGAPTTETEPNDTPATATQLPANGFASGVWTASDTRDWFRFTANAGDTIYYSLDLDPERDGTTWNGRAGIGLFSNFFLTVDDASVTSPNSEANFATVKESGTYYVTVDGATAGAGSPTSTYNLSVSIVPAKQRARCETFTTATAAQPIGPDPASPNAVQTITVPNFKRIGHLQVSVNATHNRMADLDVVMTTPANNDIVLFNDIGNAAVPPAAPEFTQLNATLDDDFATPIGSNVLAPRGFQPRNASRLSWTKGENAQGTWTLTVRDDLAAEGGTLNNWSITVCEEPPLATPAALTTVISGSDFEANDGGFTTSGTANEWERGTPSAAPITSCNSGTNCWKTDLDGGYDANSNQVLTSPAINLTAQQGRAITLRWAHRYQMESASFDDYTVEVREVGQTTGRRVFEHKAPTMTGAVGNPTVTINSTAGWSLQEVDISDFAGRNVQVVYTVTGDSTVNFSGVAVDDFSVSATRSAPAADFDQNGGTDLSVFRNSFISPNGEGTWYIVNGSNGSATVQQFGLDSDRLVPGDYDADGDVDIAVYRPSTSIFYISRGSRTNFTAIQWGLSGDIPVQGDYDGDGATDVAVFRPSNNTWYVRNSSNNSLSTAVFGLSGDRLVPADYDGDGRTDFAVFRDGVWIILESFGGTVKFVQFGAAGDTPVPADYDGDRKVDIAVFRNGVWFALRSATEVPAILPFGAAGDTPVPGDYDRDRKADFAVFRNGNWFIFRSSDNTLQGANWGLAGDRAVPPRSIPQ